MSCCECPPPPENMDDEPAVVEVEQVEEEDVNEDGERLDSVWETLMQRGSHLRTLREMERQDDLERQKAEQSQKMQQQEQQSEGDSHDRAHHVNPVVELANEMEGVVLDYEAYLQHQRYHDDLKHVDYRFIDFGRQMMCDDEFSISAAGENAEKSHNCCAKAYNENGNHGSVLVIEQDKALGKGGFCWDAAHILGDYLVSSQQSLMSRDRNHNTAPATVIELGCGTGLCGMMLAKSCPVKVTLTDLPRLMPLIQRNLVRNFAASTIASTDSSNSNSLVDNMNSSEDDDDKEDALRKYLFRKYGVNGTSSSVEGDDKSFCLFRSSRGQVEARVLEWTEEEEPDNKYKVDEKESGDSFTATTATSTFDVIVAADVVASIYNPTALARTIHRLAHGDSTVYVSFKERLSSVHRQFEQELADLFESIEFLENSTIQTRNQNPHVQILVARDKKKIIRPS